MEPLVAGQVPEECPRDGEAGAGFTVNLQRAWGPSRRERASYMMEGTFLSQTVNVLHHSILLTGSAETWREISSVWSLTCLCPGRIRDSLLAQSLAAFLDLGGDSYFKLKIDLSEIRLK